MQPTSKSFSANARAAIANRHLQQVLETTRLGFVNNRAHAFDRLPEFDRLRDEAKAIKDHTLAHLDVYLEHYEQRVSEAGGVVHWAETPDEARTIIADIARKAEARTITKGKSMVSEEIALNQHLEEAGFRVVETDLGEYIIQLRGEAPSHIIAPAVHLSKSDVETLFREHHQELDPDRSLDDPATLVAEARAILRREFIAADMGITGANMLIAETGTSVIVTNEGNGDLTQTLPRIHVVIAAIEKLVPTLEDASTIMRVLARSATGQELSVYTTFSTGPRRDGDPDGPDEYHVVILDNDRSSLLGSEFQDVLRCIRCGACMNHCPVYQSVGGHAYGWVYPGPIGAALDPALIGLEEARHLPNASSLCGRCEEVCPMRIPLPKILRHWREREFESQLTPPVQRWALRLWAYLALRPGLYHFASNLGMRALKFLGRRKGRFSRVPLASGWTSQRDLPAPEGATFQALWRAKSNEEGS
ncbi:MAG: iron-sulfur cluster-binding protein [Rhizobiales bacterium]|nr:iron-sulfur cluster-binding protein [Hyphomicrobiales bacterium]